MEPLPVPARRRDRNMANRVEVLPERIGQAHHHRKMAVAGAFVEVAGALAADRRLHHRIHVARRKPVARRPHAVHVDANRGLAQRSQDREIRDSGYLCQHSGDLLRRFLQGLQIVAVHLDGVLAFDAGCRLFDVVLDVLREIEVHAGKLLIQGVRHVLSELVLVDARRPCLERLQRHEEFSVEETRGVGAVVRPAVL